MIARKQVDKSMFLDGSHIPIAFHIDFEEANGGDLPSNDESREVTLVHDDLEYKAKLTHYTRPDGNGSRLAIQYGSSFANLLQERLPFSYQRLVTDTDDSTRPPDAIPEDEREYVEFYTTGQPYRYTVRLVQRSNLADRSSTHLPSFPTVWAELGRIIGTGIQITTLARSATNNITWAESEGIQVRTDRGNELLPKAMFESSWEELTQRGILSAEELPGEARYRSAAVTATLALLPYVDYTTYPRLTLFLTAHRFTNAQLASTFKVGPQGGIRVAGRSPNTQLVVFITEQAGDADPDHPYHDRWEGETFLYTGEGLIGPQQMTRGNLILRNNISQDFPVYGFLKLAPDVYQYKGRFKVQAVHEEQQLDNDQQRRRVFVFEVNRLRDMTNRSERSRAWVFQASPQYYDLSGAVRTLIEIPFLVNQFAREIKAGDRVYFWEAGQNAGVVGTGTVVSDPTEMVDYDESGPFYREPDRFTGSHLRAIVRVDRVVTPTLSRSSLVDHPILKQMTVITARVGTNFRVTPEQDQALTALLFTPREPQIFRISGPRPPEAWRVCRDTGLLTFDSVMTEDLAAFPSDADLEQAAVRELSATYRSNPALIHRTLAELKTIRDLRPGDRLIVTKGPSTVIGLAEVETPGYTWLTERNRHAIQVRWHWLGAYRVPRQPEWQVDLIGPVAPELWDETLDQAPATEPTPDLAAVADHFSAALRLSGIQFGARHVELVRSFIASLATKRFVILTGLSGSGKTQIALRFGDWLGKDRRLVVPVRPDWTGPDALFGYEDALKPPINGQRAWHVPPVLAFMLKAARNPQYPYLLVLDEMNLAHVERYFADFLSGMESGEPCLPNLVQDDAGNWFVPPDAPQGQIPIPDNLFVVGTVNVDETTYMFSPKVLDRANTFEFRVETDDLQVAVSRPLPLEPGTDERVRGFLVIAADDDWQEFYPAPDRDLFAQHLRTVHTLLAEGDFEFGHRVFYEALRYASLLATAGNPSWEAALDQQIYQKALPRLHGSRRRLETLLLALDRFCYDLSFSPRDPSTTTFDPEELGVCAPKLPLAFQKVRRMLRSLRANQFTSFTE